MRLTAYWTLATAGFSARKWNILSVSFDETILAHFLRSPKGMGLRMVVRNDASATRSTKQTGISYTPV